MSDPDREAVREYLWDLDHAEDLIIEYRALIKVLLARLNLAPGDALRRQCEAVLAKPVQPHRVR